MPTLNKDRSPEESSIERRHLPALRSGFRTPVTPLQLARAYERSDNSPLQIYRMLKRGVPVNRMATALGVSPELVGAIYEQQEAVRLQRQGLPFPQIGETLGVSETEARDLYARGHVMRYGADPAVQIERKAGVPFPEGVYPQSTYQRETNRDDQSIQTLLADLRRQIEPQGLRLETTFEADPLGGRHVVKVVKDNEVIGQPFRLTATPHGVPLVSKTGKSAGGYRLTFQGQEVPLGDRLGQAIREMSANHFAQKAAAASQPPVYDDNKSVYDLPDYLNELIPDDNDGSYSSDQAPPPPPPFEEDVPLPASIAAPARSGQAKGPLNVLDILDVMGKNRQNAGHWRQINAGDFTRLTYAGQFREENAEGLVKDAVGRWDYPAGLSQNYRPGQAPYTQPAAADLLTPVVSKGSVYPLEARNYIAGNIAFEDVTGHRYQWGSQKNQGKQIKRDELSLTRKYWSAGPALGVAYPEVPQHILGQRATEPEVAHIARALILDRGGIIPEGQMWKDTTYAPWVFGSFEQNPEKFELRFDAQYSEQEVLKAAGLWDEAKGGFRPRLLKPGRGKISAPNGFSKDVLRNNEAGYINDYEIVDTMNDRGEKVKALRIKGYFGNRPNIVSAMKLEGWKNLAQDKHIREKLGLNYDLIMNKPSDPVVANISMLNALPRAEFEGLWREVHGETPAPTRTNSMADVENLAKVWQLYQERNRVTEILRGQVFDADTLKNYLEAGIIKDGKYEAMPPLFEGAETMYKADLIVTGAAVPVRARYITDVTKLGRGNLSNEILRSVEFNHPGLGDYLREQGYQGRDLYNTLFEMHQLNTKPGFDEAGSPVVDLLGDLGGRGEVRAAMESLYEQRLAEILPESMRGLDRQSYTSDQERAYAKFKAEAGAQAIRQYYSEALGDDSFIFRIGDPASAAYMVNPGLLDKFGYLDEETNEKISQLRSDGDYLLKSVWNVVQTGDRNGVARLKKWLPKKMQGVIRDQEALLASPSARKRWFGTSSSAIQTHVHASDYALPRNAMAKSWDDLFTMTGLKRTRTNRAYLNALSRAGKLLFSGLRNPASDPIAQTNSILNMVTPDLLRDAGLDVVTTGHGDTFHPHYIQKQGGDNDSDESQVYAVLKQVKDAQSVAGSLVNAFGLKPSDPEAITQGAQDHAAGEYRDALEKLKVSQAKARRNLLGFDPSAQQFSLDGTRYTPATWMGETLREYRLNSRQIGQSYNLPIRIGINVADGPAAKWLISQYGGWMYQNPLDKVNYQPHSPEEDLFSFFTSFNAYTGAFTPSRAEDETEGTYYSFRKKFSDEQVRFTSRYQFGAAGLLAILKRLTKTRQGTQAKLTPEQMAAMMSRTNGDLVKTAKMIEGSWSLPDWSELDSKSITKLQVSDQQRKMLDVFAHGDSPLAQMMRGFSIRNALKGASRLQRKLQEDTLDPALRASMETGEKNRFRGELREYVNVMQNDLYNYGNGVGSPEFKADYETFLGMFGRSKKDNWFFDLEPGNPKQERGAFYGWPEAQRLKFYQEVGRLMQQHMTGYGRDEQGRWRNLDPSVARNNAMLAEGYPDYDRIRDMMAVNAKERSEDEVESFVPTLDELARSEVTGPLVREKYNRKQKLLGGLARLFEKFKTVSGRNGSTQPDEDFENFVIGKLPYTLEEQGMWEQAERGFWDAHRLRFDRFKRAAGYKDDEPLYFAEGGVLEGATRIGQTRRGRDIIAGEAGREYVVPENKTRDVGNGVKVFDADELGRGAYPGATQLAKGGIIDYRAYAAAPASSLETAFIAAASELSGNFAPVSLAEAKTIVGRKIEADIQKLMVSGPKNGGKGLYATDLTGRATDLMSQYLGPNPDAGDQKTWNEFLSNYGLSADFQPLDVRSSAVGLQTRKELTKAGISLNDFLKNISASVQGKLFSHANYGHVYNAIPGWAELWQGGRPGATIPQSQLTAAGQSTLARLLAGVNGAGAPPSGPQGDPTDPVPPGQLNEVVTVPKLTPQLMGEYRQVFQQLGTLQDLDPAEMNKEQLAQLKLAGARGTDVFRIAQRSKSLLYQEQLQHLVGAGINSSQMAEYRRLIETYGNRDPDLIDNLRGFTPEEKSNLIGTIYSYNDKSTAEAERYLFGRMEELHRNVRERGLSLTDSQSRLYERLSLGYKTLDPQQLQLAHEFNTWYSGEFPDLQERIPLINEQEDPVYLGGAHPAFNDAYINTVLPQAKAARLRYEANQVFKNLTPGTVQSNRPDLAEVVHKAESVPAASEALNRRIKTEKEGLRLGELDRRLRDIGEWYGAGQGGRSEAFTANPQPMDDALDLSMLYSRRKQAYEEAVPLKQQYDLARQRGDLKTAQNLFDQIHPLNTVIGELKDEIAILTPHVKEYIDTLSEQTGVIRDDLKERKQTYSALAGKHKELLAEAVGLSGEELRTKQGTISTVQQEMDTVHGQIKTQARELGRLTYEKETLTDLLREPQGRAIAGLGARPQTHAEAAMQELRQGYSPQKLFWEFQNIQQMQFMAFQPMLRMQQQYLGEQAALGQAQYALGAGGMPASVLNAMASQANMNRASSAFGRGVDNSIAMNAWRGLTNFLGQNTGAGSFLGAAGFDLTSALTAAMGFKMVGMPAVSAVGRLLPALGVRPTPYLGPGGGPGLGATTLAAAGTGGGLASGLLGLGAGLGGYEWLARPLAQSMGRSAPGLSQFATVGAYEMGGYGHGGWDSLWNNALTRAVADKTGLAGLMGWKVWDQKQAEQLGGAVGKYTGAVTDPIPVWVTKIESEVSKQLGALPFDRTDLAQMVQMAAEDQGITQKQIEETPGVAEKLAKEIADSVTSGVSLSQQSQLRQRAIDVSGYAPGTAGSRMMSEWVQQGSQFERQQRLQAGQMVQNLADMLDFTPEQRRNMSERVYGLLSEGVSQTQVSRAMQQRGMTNQFYWSQAAYASGNPQMAMMDQDQPWLQKHQADQWAIEDRRRAEDNARNLGVRTTTFYGKGQGSGGFGIMADTWSGGRQEQELGWERQKLDLEQEFWTFRRKSQLDDFGMQQKLFEFSIKQQRQAMEFEERQNRVQTNYYERQYVLNKQIFDLQTQYQRQDFDKQEGRLDIQRSWQLEDSAWNRESYQIQSGWQMEDLQRALRYAGSGRERMDIRRQIERASIMNERKGTEFDREDARATVKYDWAKEDLAENRQRFEEMNDLQRQQMELGREYWLEQQSLATAYRDLRKADLAEQIGLQQEQNALTVQQFNDSMTLQDKQHALDTQINEVKHQWAIDDLALARQRSVEDEKILGWQRETTVASSFYAFYQAMGFDAANKANPVLAQMAKAASDLADNMERAAQAQAQMAGGSNTDWWQGIPSPANPAGPQQTPYVGMPIIKNGFAQGGYTGDGDTNQVAGLVHRGEYAVPQNGALVMQDSSSVDIVNLLTQTVALQTAILAQLQEGGGTILIDAERLKRAGFLHQSNFQQVYK